ncbi:hypothetical protein BG015_011203 [Linnemannia schmuckeri]|uniref:Uncharacterized protein n=1 Tax=Linnemannia schmuckeri TaxID=64567 RepID=A0A9P5RT24_9FUNG|nr:hypothetical protein BG015_011203 [Linnemannia schmuckeri]
MAAPLRPRSTSSTSPRRPFSLWSTTTTLTFLTISLLTLSTLPITPFTEAAPAKHTLAPANLLTSMSIQFSDTAPLPLQLQIESQVRGSQKLAYLPTTGPSLDFYYLNYRPTYLAGSGQIDFWMLTPEGSQAPATGSLELFDEYGKIRLATLVEEGTEIPREVANKNQPFLWKSWKIPKTLQADFDFSEKFRIVLKTSDHIAAAKKAAAASANANANGNKNEKRQFDDAGLVDFLLVKNKNKHVTSADNASTLKFMGAGNMVVQDRQFRIKGLAASPGGKPNPAKLNVNPINTSPKSDDKSTTTSSNSNNNVKPNKDGKTVTVDKSSNDKGRNVQATAARSAVSPAAHAPQFTALMAVVLAATMGASFF